MENIKSSLGARASFGNKRLTVNFTPELPEELRVYVPFQRTSYIYRPFLYWEYQLGILLKGTTYQTTSPFMKEELRKLDTITAQVDYLAKTASKRWTIFFQLVKPFKVKWTHRLNSGSGCKTRCAERHRLKRNSCRTKSWL